ncbi:MAG: acyltransferase domain-containing protein, partial [Mycobacterium sp.]
AGAGVRLADVAHTLNHHRARHPKLAAVCARDPAQALAGLHALAAGHAAAGVVGPHEGRCGSGTVFVYSGQGSQWAGMGRQLLVDEPAFAKAVGELEPVFVEQVGFSLQQVLADGEAVRGDARVQPVIMGLQLALTQLWSSYGVNPDAVIGHSMGEVTAAVVAGALSVAEGLRVIATRSRLMSRLAGQGAVALLELDTEAAEVLIATHPGVSVAGFSSPRQTVIAGPPAQVDALIAAVTEQGRFARRVNMEVASHNALMDPILPELHSALADLTPTTPTIPFLSTVIDSTTPTLDADYWVANVRQPVRLSQAITIAADNHTTFIEISPHPTLTHAITETLESATPNGRVLVTSTMNRVEDPTLFFHSQLAAMGVTPTTNGEGHLADIPTTPWQHSAFWIPDRSAAWSADNAHPLLGAHTEVPPGCAHVWQADVGTDVFPWLADYQVHGQAIMPAAGFAEIALAAATEALGLPVHAVSINQLTVEQILPLECHTPITTQLTHGADNTIRVEVHSRLSNGDWRRHAAAQIDASTDDVVPDVRGRFLESLGTTISPADFYAGQHHGRAFAALTRIVRLPHGVSETEITLPDEAPRYPGCRIHPVTLDASLQALVAAMPDSVVSQSDKNTYLPVSFDAIRVFGEVGRHARCRAELISSDDDGMGELGRIMVTDDAGKPTAEITGVHIRRVEREAIPLPLGQKLFEAAWVESPVPVATMPPTSAATAGSWLVLRDDTYAKTTAD